MNTTLKLTSAALLALAVQSAHAAPADAVNQIRENARNVMGIINKANGKNDAQIRQQAQNYAIPYFDFEQMTALAVGNPWRTATPQQKAQMTTQFKNLLLRTYSGTLLKFKGAKVDVGNTPVVNGQDIIVRTTITPPGGKAVNMDYTTYPSGGKYKVKNVSVEGASLVTVYRNQFGQTINQKGFNGLINDLKAKNGVH